MADLGSNVFSQTDSSNASGTMPSWSGSANPNTIDDAGRALQGAITREWYRRNFTQTAGGSANAKTLTYSVAPAALYDGQEFSFWNNTTNTGAVTLNINALGAKTVKKESGGTFSDLASGDMPANRAVKVSYKSADDIFVWTNYTAFSTTASFSFTAAQTIAPADAATNTVTDALTLGHTTSGTAAASFGTGLVYQLENAAGTTKTAASIDAVWTDATNGSEDVKLSFKTMVAGAAKAEAGYAAAGFVWGAPTGGDKGAGTINATALYDDGILMSPWRHIATLTPSAVANVDQTGLSSYKALRVTLIDVRPATDDVIFRVNLSSDGSTYLTTNYAGYAVQQSTGAYAATAANGNLFVNDTGLNIGNASGDGGISGTIHLHNFNVAQKTMMSGQLTWGDASGAVEFTSFHVWHTGQTAMQAIRFLFSSGNITSGTIIIEGLP